MSWRAVADDPCEAGALAHRDAVLQRAFRAEERRREELLAELCRGRRVLDLGCVHTVAEIQKPWWLHSQLEAVAAEIVGVDLNLAGVRAMRDAGYEAIQADISGDISEIELRGRFDVVVAGELIEHLDAPIDLFRFSLRVLEPDGVLVITTPNPYSPVRARRGARRETWESVDHVAYYPPTGIAELSERAGMQLTMATTVNAPRSRHMLARTLKRRLRREADEFSLFDVLIYRLRGGRGQLGETAIYVVRPRAE